MSALGGTEEPRSARLDAACAAILAALSLFLFFYFIPTFAPGEGGPGQIAPSFFPRLAVVVVFVCAVLVLIGALRRGLGPATGSGGQLLTELVGWSAYAGTLLAILSFFGFVVAGVFAVACGTVLTRFFQRPLLSAALAIALPLLLNWGVWSLFWIELP